MANLLIVDDNIDLCEVISSYLEDKFEDIKLAHNVPQAIGLVKESLFTFIIIDLHLISGNGETLIKYIRRDDSKNCETPILVISGEIGFDKNKFSKTEFLSKPFNENDLFSKISLFKKKKVENQSIEQTATHPELAKILRNR